MAKKQTPLNVETLTHEEARRRNIPTAEFQTVMQKEEQSPVRVSPATGEAIGCINSRNRL
jgi:adenine-specific DNA-methyltransferase